MATDLLSTHFKDLRINTTVSTNELMGTNEFCIHTSVTIYYELLQYRQWVSKGIHTALIQPVSLLW